MEGPLIEHHESDAYGNPAGGRTTARGIQIDWQSGPLNVGGVRIEPDGAFVEDVIRAAIGRLRYYQGEDERGHKLQAQTGVALSGASSGKFACRENACAITHLEEGLMWLRERTRSREARAVEGTHVP